MLISVDLGEVTVEESRRRSVKDLRSLRGSDIEV